jgi:hypothetical protein
MTSVARRARRPAREPRDRPSAFRLVESSCGGVIGAGEAAGSAVFTSSVGAAV